MDQGEAAPPGDFHYQEDKNMEAPEDALTADGFDEAIIGLAERATSTLVVAYDFDMCVGILVSRDGMSYEDAVEYMTFNVTGAWVGEGTPVFVHLGPIENIEDAEDYMEENY
jgi:hypothetical protein